MTAQSDLKKRIRARQAKTGESYTTARQHILRARDGDDLSVAPRSGDFENRAEEIRMTHYEAIEDFLRLVRQYELLRAENMERHGGDHHARRLSDIIESYTPELTAAELAPFEFLMRMPRDSVILIEALMYLGRDGRTDTDLTLAMTLQDMQNELHHGAASQICDKKHVEKYRLSFT